VLGAGAVAGADGGLRLSPPSLLTFLAVAGGLCTILLLEFVAVSLEMTDTEVRFSITPFYRRRALISDIQDWEVRTYPSVYPAGYYSWLRGWLREGPTHCVLVRMKDGSRMEFTCVHAEHLAHAINRAKDLMDHHLQATSEAAIGR
jgi:hypothetical protein